MSSDNVMFAMLGCLVGFLSAMAVIALYVGILIANDHANGGDYRLDGSVHSNGNGVYHRQGEIWQK